MTGARFDSQVQLKSNNIAEFYHDNFVADQVRDFRELVIKNRIANGLVADVGGGCGYFVEAIQRSLGIRGRVLDADAVSIARCRERGLDARLFDALNPDFDGDERLACFNLILHHLVGSSERATRQLQTRALRKWRGQCNLLFVNEYIYDSLPKRGFSARVIYEVTRSATLSRLAALISRVAPSLQANTFGVGVRFRTAQDWRQLFAEAGYNIIGYRRGEEEPRSLARRLMMISSIRRDSFLLAPNHK